MSTTKSNRWALFGGAGFIGQHLACSVLDRMPRDRVVLLDIQRPSEASWKAQLAPFLGSDRLTIVECDVRDAEAVLGTATNFDVIVNLAAVHREPGHKTAEYFETNVGGAENICRMADTIGCQEIIFTSSISVYGVHDRPVDEHSVVSPRTPYGQSKHQAEEIHREWARRTGARLTIIRPGVVFGPGEEGNVSRLVREMLKRGRAIYVKPDQPKAGIYIEELLDVFHWLKNQPLIKGDSLLVNGVSNDCLTFNAFGGALQNMQGWNAAPLTIPGSLLGTVNSLMKPLAGLFPARSKFHPQRLAKLITANDIRPAALNKMGYPFSWPLERALADWSQKGL